MNYKEDPLRLANAIIFLDSKGWKYLPYKSYWYFRSPSGTIHDLSAADLQQLDRIEKERLFLVKND